MFFWLTSLPTAATRLVPIPAACLRGAKAAALDGGGYDVELRAASVARPTSSVERRAPRIALRADILFRVRRAPSGE